MAWERPNDADRLKEAEQRIKELEAERERLRARTHEIAEAKDAEHRQAMKDYGQLRRAVDEAIERTKNWTADWTTVEDVRWWDYTSSNHRKEVIALVARALDGDQARQRIKELEGTAEQRIELERAVSSALGYISADIDSDNPSTHQAYRICDELRKVLALVQSKSSNDGGI